MLRHVVTKEEKVKMAAALFNGETQKMDYVFKDYNSKRKWKLFQGWLAVKHLPKFLLSGDMTLTTSN